MIEASTQFMVGSLSTESGKCNSFNLDGIFGNDNGNVIDIFVQPRRDQCSAVRFFRRLLKGQESEPWRLVTDKLRSYSDGTSSGQPTTGY